MKNHRLSNTQLGELGRRIINPATNKPLIPQQSPITNQAVQAMLRRSNSIRRNVYGWITKRIFGKTKNRYRRILKGFNGSKE